MSLEIERRFLVKGEDWRQSVSKEHEIQQAYLTSSKDGWTVRVRITDNQNACLTLKAKAEGVANYEFEYPIPLEDGLLLWEKLPNKITKTRFTLNLKEGDWIIDCFKKQNSPLVLAEVELASEKTQLHKPTWCGQEITGKFEWSNASLAKNPINTWDKSKKLQYMTH